jgi:uncharacterized protein YhbP (UPF0306 family)
VAVTADGRDTDTVRAAIESVLDSTRLLTMATVLENGFPWVHNAYFAFDESLVLYILTPPQTTHSANLVNNAGVVAVAVADSQQPGLEGTRRGLQLIGTCRRTVGSTMDRGLHVYRVRFPERAHMLVTPQTLQNMGSPLRLYEFEPVTYRLFDEVTFGARSRVTGDILRPKHVSR